MNINIKIEHILQIGQVHRWELRMRSDMNGSKGHQGSQGILSYSQHHTQGIGSAIVESKAKSTDDLIIEINSDFLVSETILKACSVLT